MQILTVCLGNICRSPTAEAALRAHLPEAVIDSAGTGDWHVGRPPYPPMQRAAAARGLDLSALRARQVTPADFDRFDLILTMDADNTRDVEALRPPGNTTPVQAMTDALPAPDAGQPVPDPYFTGDYDGALALIDRAARAWAARLTS
ncbi:low molecular weight protein-tyrosine-phosphatase [Pseudaestuariivita atlantica]|uniref:protein-tyrosine-phosphatase n=1 Tax=Pseudaestuariivita atlantica TaxID=1317121 RepID=A0A0L1JTU9_9RHOB|nr:low molecular weight protein-tyrosine-phosphatase [Pseudaestuariivita atlantica]KNG95175.1 phosphotyrosine protein phosphatase [Pseudaestuariivita atlantica]